MTERERATDRQTDRQTDEQTKVVKHANRQTEM